MLNVEPEAGPPPGPLLVKPEDAARMLAVSTRTLWSLSDDGKLAAVRIGRSVRYAVSDLEAFIASRKAEKGAA